MKNVKIDTDYIKLDQLLKLANIVSGGGEAHALILSSAVKVNGNVELQKRKKIVKGDVVQIADETITVI